MDTFTDTGCPAPSEVSCVEGDLCSKHKHCGQSEICCPNKCYRRRCTAGTPTAEDLENEEDSEESKEEETKGAAASSVSKKGIIRISDEIVFLCENCFVYRHGMSRT